MNKNTKIDKRELLYEILLSKGIGKLTRRAEKLLLLLSEKAMRRTSSKEFDTDYYDYLQNAYLIIFSNWWKFNINVTNNAFAYYTEMHKRAVAEARKELYNLKGIKSKEDQKNMKKISLNSSNNGQGLYNF